jgi:DNA-binding IclR family transcriptional regulator
MRRDPIKSAARTLEILELFQEQRSPLRLTYIFEKLGYPQSSTTTLLKSMVVLGYLNYDRASRTYFPTPRVAALGDWVNHHLFGSGDLDRLVKSIFEQTNETVVISSQNDIFIQHLRIVQPSHPHKIAMTEGSMRVLPHSAAGLVLMSRMPSKAVDKLCRHINAYLGGTSDRIDIAQLQEQLTWVRREGYSLLAAFPFPNAAGIAMPLPAAPHGVQLTLGVGGLNSRIARHKSEIVAIMKAGVADYAESLRHYSVPEA